MSFQIDVLSDVKAAGGSSLGGLPSWDPTSSYGMALDGNAFCRVGVPAEFDASGLLRVRRVLSLIRAETSASGTLTQTRVGEYRIRRVQRRLEQGIVWVEAHPILLDLGDIYVSQATAGGLRSFRIEASDLTPTEWIDQYVIPSLEAHGITWIDRGTVTPTTPRTLSFSGWTCLELLRELTGKTDYHPTLEPDGDTRYLLHVTEVGVGAAAPQLVVGRNVEALGWEHDGIAQATVIIPQGVTNSGELEPRGAEEFAARISATGATDVTLADPDGNDAPLKFDDQENGAVLEALLPAIQLRDLSGVAIGAAGLETIQTADEFLPEHAAYASSSGELAVTAVQQAGTTGRVVFYSAATRAYAGIVTVGTSPKGIYYHAGQDRLYVANSGSGTVSVINPATRAVVATITVGTSPQQIALATSSGYLYVTNNGGSSVSVINPATNTVVTTIAGITSPTDVCYDVGNDRIVVCASAGDLKFINPGTNTVANTLALGGTINAVAYLGHTGRLYVARTSSNDVKVVNGSGTPSLVTTITGLTSPAWVFPVDLTDEVWVVYNSSQLAVIVAGSPDFVELSGRHIGHTAGKPGAVVSAQRLVWVPCKPTGRGWLAPVDVDSHGAAIRRTITDSVRSTQKITIGTVAPLQVEDLISFRADLAGTFRGELAHAIKAAAPPTGYGVVSRRLTSSLWRGERNYVLNPWGERAGPDGLTMPGWDRSRHSGGRQPEIVYSAPDASSWLTFAAQADGAHSIGATLLNLKALTTGDVLQSGDHYTLPSGNRLGGSRAVVDGAGKATVSIPGGLAAGFADGQAITVTRSHLPTSELYAGTRIPVLWMDAGTSTAQELGVAFPVPGIVGRSTLWITLEVLVWPISGFQPSTKLALRVYEGATQITELFPSDTATYADQVLRAFELSYAHTIAPQGPRMISAYLRLPTGSVAAVYVRRIQATLGTEGALTPAFRVNASRGELYHAGWRAVRDLADPPVNYEVQATEDDPTLSIALGCRPILEHPAQGIAATPRAVSIEYPLPSPTLSGTTARRPVVQLDNRPPSLARLLAEAGIA